MKNRDENCRIAKKHRKNRKCPSKNVKNRYFSRLFFKSKSEPSDTKTKRTQMQSLNGGIKKTKSHRNLMFKNVCFRQMLKGHGQTATGTTVVICTLKISMSGTTKSYLFDMDAPTKQIIPSMRFWALMCECVNVR